MNKLIEPLNIWTTWKPMPSPGTCRKIIAPQGPGVYQLRNKRTKELVLFGIGVECQRRMKSLFPAPYGCGKRNNGYKRAYVLQHWRDMEYRTMATSTRADAKVVEDRIKDANNHIYNT